MNKRLATLASALLLGAALGAGGCVDNRASVQVQMICLPNDSCTFSGTCDGEYIGYPTIDVTTSSGTLWLILQVANQVPNNESIATGRVNTMDAHVDETVIEYEGALGGGEAVGSNFRVPAGGTSLVSVQMTLGAAAAPGEVLAHVRLRGYRDDGSRFETGDFPITIATCAGCLPPVCGGLTCPPDSEGTLPIKCLQ